MRAAAGAILVLALAGCATPQASQTISTESVQAEPSADRNSAAIRALESEMNRRAQEVGAYAALRDMAFGRAVTFVPRPVNARAWLGDQPVPPMEIGWSPQRIIMSCDGKTGVATGAIRWGETDGYYTTVWQFFGSTAAPKEGAWRWTLSHGDALDRPRIAPATLTTQTASCEGSPNVAISAPPEGARFSQTQSEDQSLSYSWLYRPDGSREIAVKIWDGTQHNVVLLDAVSAENQTGDAM